jgi:UDP-N-acetylglucosamine 4,6-dehydratase
MRYRIGNVRDYDRLYEAFEDVDIVIHAAAMKCIDVCQNEPKECYKTNIAGTQNVIDAAKNRKVRKVLFISTDKAVNAINAYGKSKAMAEELIIDANKCVGDKNIKFSVCRYGNVIGSAKSVIPFWAKLAKEGFDKLPVTDLRMTRFFWSMDEAVQFVIDSLEKMEGGEIFIPKLKSARMTDVAKAFGCGWYEVGIREGEKLHEELAQGYDSESAERLTVQEIKKYIKEWTN